MKRPPRYIPSGGALVEVTTRTIQGRFLLRPSRAGIHFGKALLEGRSLLAGKWVDRTKKYRLEAQGKGKEVKPKDYTTTLTVELEQLPCWAHLSWREYIRRVTGMIREIERKAAAERALRGVEVVGAAAVCQKDPQTRPNKVKDSPAPLVHAASRKARLAWREAFSFFLTAYREAAELLRRGVLDAPFPEGCFPPGLPFVGGAGGLAAAPG